MHPKELLQAYNLEPKKSLGQNFLFDPNILGRIADAAELTLQDEVLEIGPGLGSLTAVLAQRAQSVTAVELDQRFMPILQRQLVAYSNIRLVHGDILAQNPADWFERPYKVVANVPYYITGAILRHLLSATPKPSRVVMTVQKEVAERVTAAPPQMSLLAVSVQFYGRAKLEDTIKAGAFWPRPDVDSAIMSIDLTTTNNSDIDEDAFFRLVKVGFSQKRKQLQKNLQQLGNDKKQIRQRLTAARIDGTRRAETLHLDEWVALYQAFHQV